VRIEARAFCRAAAVEPSSCVAGEAGAANCDVGTGSILASGAAELGAGVPVAVAEAIGEGPDVAAGDPFGDAVGAVVPQAATITARIRAAAALTGPNLFARSGRIGFTWSMVSEKVAALALSRRGRLPLWFGRDVRTRAVLLVF
jgi:hypothetical protein